MGKVEDMRLLREQIRQMEQAPGKRPPKKVAPQAPPPGEELCGHGAISGKRCIRPAGHAEKNHRYARST